MLRCRDEVDAMIFYSVVCDGYEDDENGNVEVSEEVKRNLHIFHPVSWQCFEGTSINN